MPDLDFGDNDEEAIIVLKGFAHRVNNDLYNSGRDGLLTRFNNFIVEHKTQENLQEKRHIANVTRQNIVIALLGILIAAVGLVRGCSAPVKSMLDPNKIFHTQSKAPETAKFDADGR